MFPSIPSALHLQTFCSVTKGKGLMGIGKFSVFLGLYRIPICHGAFTLMLLIEIQLVLSNHSCQIFLSVVISL